MKRLGVSVYLNSNNLQENIQYINLASKYGFEIVFTTLISINDSNFDKYYNDFVNLVKYSNNIGMKVIADVEPEILKKIKHFLYKSNKII